MKTCVIYGDMSADSAADQYPTVNLCNDCVATDDAQGENHQIVIKQAYDHNMGDTCEWCV
ncbi:hypothetical protein PVE_R1G2420 [Pseudomonas veronii 1YdBTEX2]|jgi:hypothetical protein|uniref:Uncharacterized protein n=1 Tax=Pseudomonas veronii 1YdBTEX2 TaxID=1295141 RepID=A0A1D3JWC2_PSEVE|nr:hypothetical protein [Pseudomonas veronii]SBW80305.1 hypothetical protein PVE_R1G2420 [Pseudomonas veronii 1YdBTEX2]